MIPNSATVGTEATPSNDSGKGQEEIYFSDGLTIVPPSLPSTVEQHLRSSRVNDHPNDVLDDGGKIDPAEAFEVFKGKIFAPSSNDDDYFRSPRFVSRTVETPFQRLSRLRMEISELEGDIQQQQQMLVPTNPSEAHNIQDEDDTHQLVLLENMTQMARDLASRLDSIGTISPAALSTSVISSAGQETAIHASLTNLVQDQIQQIKNLNMQDVPKIAPLRKDTGSSSSSTVSHIILLEQRLTQIEKVLGSNGANPKVLSSSSILQRLEDAENIVSCLNKEGLDLMATRAKFIRSDLEAALKARSKLSTSLSGTPAASQEDSQLISSLYESMKSVEGVSSQLPLIVNRLNQLAFLHTQAADFANRLVATEKSSTELERLLCNLEDTLQKVEKGCIENLHVMEKNVLLLDERLQNLKSPKAVEGGS